MYHALEHECERCGWEFECTTYPCRKPFKCHSCVTIEKAEEELEKMELDD